MRFSEKYPQTPLLIELKSKTLSQRLVEKLQRKIEEMLPKNHEGDDQVKHVVQFLRSVVYENKFVNSWEEIQEIRSHIGAEHSLKVLEHAGKLKMRLVCGKYFLLMSIAIPDEYPAGKPEIVVNETNILESFMVVFVNHAMETARRLAEPARTPEQIKFNLPRSDPRPWLLTIVKYFHKCVTDISSLQCPLCHRNIFPAEPSQQITSRTDPYRIERIYCGHFYHFACADYYMRTPPFLKEGKPCRAPGCGRKISHDLWHSDYRKLEKGWAMDEARKREIDDVMQMLALDEFAVAQPKVAAPYSE